MPEGDTVHKLARAMRPALEGRRLEEVWVRDRGVVDALAGKPLTEIAAVGKHLLMVIDDDTVLHTHLGMRGKWHRYAPGERWKRAPSTAVAALRTEEHVFVVFHAMLAEVMRRIDVRLHPRLSRLGPDLLGETFDTDEAARRARARAADGVDLGDLLLDQTVACGAGNVYKSEVPFTMRLHPRTRAAALADADLARLFERTRELMQMNLGGWKRTTTYRVEPGAPPPAGMPRLHVYGRAAEPCLACGTTIEAERQGDGARPTYWCPTCQPAPA